MDHDPFKRSIVSGVVGLLVVAILYFFVPGPVIAPRGIFLPTHQANSVVDADQVTLYNATNAPIAYESLGTVSALYHTPIATEEGEEKLVNYVKQLAARSGANGVIVSVFGHTLPSEVPSSQGYFIIRGKAIYAAPMPAI